MIARIGDLSTMLVGLNKRGFKKLKIGIELENIDTFIVIAID
jgi:hypothetical protein